MPHPYRRAYKRSGRASRLPIPEGGFRGNISSSRESALPKTPSEPFPKHPWPLIEEDDDDVVPVAPAGHQQGPGNKTGSRRFDAKPASSGRFIRRPIFTYLENTAPPWPVFSAPSTVPELDGFPQPPTLADIQRMEPDLTPLEQMMRASDVDQAMLARAVNAHKGLSGITTSRTFLGVNPKTVIKGTWMNAQPEPVPAEATRTPPKPSDDMAMFPAPPTLVDIQRMEPDMPLMQQLMRASDANPEYLKKVLNEEKKKGGVVLARDTIRKTAESVTSASSQSPSVAAALAKWVVLQFLVTAVSDPPKIFWSFVDSYTYNKALIAVEQIIDILGNDPIALVHAMVYLQRIFKDLRLDGQQFVSHDLEQQRNAVAVIRRVVVIAFLLGLKYSRDEFNLTICDNWARALGFKNRKFLVVSKWRPVK
ncbi:hypothetical protein CPB85DRAFT_1432211 [Mucidula mucida]|nr:hypothetical protein CPB85DRAFT_1432211 [Mucidula mucida]